MIKMAGDNDGDDDEEEEDVVDGINGDDDDDCLYLFIKAIFLEFRLTHNTLQSTISQEFTPLQCQLVLFCIFTELLDTKLLEKSNFETPEGTRLNHKF